jgi:hypothetical protein
MDNTNRQFIALPSQSVRAFLDELSMLPLLTHCIKCEARLLHVDIHVYLLRWQDLGGTVVFLHGL